MEQKSFFTLLEDIINDSDKVPFPIETIRLELTHLFLSQDEFQYFYQEAYKKLKSNNGEVISSIFLQVLQNETKYHEENVYLLDFVEYCTRIEKVIQTLESIQISIIPRDSPDYEVVWEMSKI